MSKYERMTEAQTSEALTRIFGYAPELSADIAMRALILTPLVQVHGEYGAVAIVWGDGYALMFDDVSVQTICEACAVAHRHWYPTTWTDLPVGVAPQPYA